MPNRNGWNERWRPWIWVLMCCDPTRPAESGRATMLFWPGAAVNKQHSKSRCMSHQPSASAAEKTVSPFIWGGFSTKNTEVVRKKRQRRERETPWRTPWLGMLSLSRLHVKTSICVHKCRQEEGGRFWEGPAHRVHVHKYVWLHVWT